MKLRNLFKLIVYKENNLLTKMSARTSPRSMSRIGNLHNEFIKAVKDLIVESSTSGGLNKDSAQRTCEIHPKIAEEEDATSKKH